MNDGADDSPDRSNSIDFAEMVFYEDFYRDKPGLDIISAARDTHQSAFLKFFQELQIARDLLYEPHENSRILAVVRAYRAVEWYQTQMRSAIIEAFVDPFRHLFTKPIKPRSFLRDDMLLSLQASVFREAFGEDVLATFYLKHAEFRNQVIHGLEIPTVDGARALVGDALIVFNRADASLNPSATHPLKLPSLTHPGLED